MPECKNFCCSDFYIFKDPDITHTADLNNPIHPILSKTRFPADVDYSTLEMSLRLASRLLALDSAVRHIVIMTDGEMSVIPNSGGRFLRRSPGPKKHPDDHSPDLPEDDDNYYHWRASEILQQAIEHIRFFVDDDQLGKSGYTAHREGPWTAAQASRLNAPGVGSDIHIGGGSWKRLKAPQNNRAGTLCDQFELARIVVHELSHALENLYTGWRRTECFCESNNLSERGHDMEAAIFGGLLDIVWSEQLMQDRKEEYCLLAPRRPVLNPCMILYQWPNQVFADMYRFRRLKMGRLEELNRSYQAQRVHLSFVQSLLSNAYWSTVGNSDLVIPRMEKSWGVRWFESADIKREAIHPWLSPAECKYGVAANSEELLAQRRLPLSYADVASRHTSPLGR